jgi:hypothetical protein
MPIYQAPLLVWDFLASSVNVSSNACENAQQMFQI